MSPTFSPPSRSDEAMPRLCRECFPFSVAPLPSYDYQIVKGMPKSLGLAKSKSPSAGFLTDTGSSVCRKPCAQNPCLSKSLRTRGKRQKGESPDPLSDLLSVEKPANAGKTADSESRRRGADRQAPRPPGELAPGRADAGNRHAIPARPVCVPRSRRSPAPVRRSLAHYRRAPERRSACGRRRRIRPGCRSPGRARRTAVCGPPRGASAGGGQETPVRRRPPLRARLRPGRRGRALPVVSWRKRCDLVASGHPPRLPSHLGAPRSSRSATPRCAPLLAVGPCRAAPCRLAVGRAARRVRNLERDGRQLLFSHGRALLRAHNSRPGCAGASGGSHMRRKPVSARFHAPGVPDTPHARPFRPRARSPRRRAHGRP